MTPDWQSFLASEGAVFAADRVEHFGQPETERRAAANGNVLVDLSALALIRARGADALAFLNAQLSNDLRALDAQHSQLAAWCNAKGRMLALFRVWRRGEDYLLLLPAERRDAVLNRLRLFVLRSKVVLDSADGELARLGVSGPDAPRLVHEAVGFLAEGPNASRTQGDVSVLSLPGPAPRFLLVAPYATAVSLWKTLKVGALPAGFEVWTWLDIQAGLPQIYTATSEAFVPQMANLDLLGGVSFTKGCYPGQEIISRLHHRGGLKQRLYRAHVQTGAVPVPGIPVYATTGPGGSEQNVGSVVCAAPAPQGGWDMLLVVNIAEAESSTLHLGTEDRPRLDLPLTPVADRAARVEV